MSGIEKGETRVIDNAATYDKCCVYIYSSVSVGHLGWRGRTVKGSL